MKPFKPPTPVATNTIIGLCVAVQGALLLSGPALEAAIIANYGLVPAQVSAALAGSAPIGAAAASAFTHMLLHGGIVHLALNMVFLAWVGRYVEWVAGSIGLICIFLVGGIIGGAAQVLSAPASGIPIIGASGAIACVFGAYAVMFAQNSARPRAVLGIIIAAETLTALWFAGTWIALQLLIGLAFNGPDGPGIAIWTHIGGFLAGLLLGRLWGKGPDILT